MRFIQRRHIRLLAIGLFTTLGGCSSSTSIKQTFEHSEYVGREYSNVLVLAMAASYNARTRFERAMASDLRSGDTTATSYYEIAAGDQEVTREKILAAIRTHGYDGVVVTQLGSQQSEVNVKTGPSTAKVTRRDERPADFFRYDYEVLNEPQQINVAAEVVLVTDFFDASDASRIWAVESTISDKENIDYLVEDAARMIAARIRKDGLLAD